jgi:glycosyltransferase involved in cell wall biosynthesis/SAM-dependent methyltransferase
VSILLSIIVPVYRVEAYIRECLDSVFKQLPDGVEVILVDDGSPDDSIGIVRREYTQWLERGVLIILEQANAGPGAARNAGLARAQGRYIGFLDSDDVMLEGYFNELIDRLQLGVADVFEFGFKRFSVLEDISREPYHRLYPLVGLKKLALVREQVFASSRWFPSLRIYRRNYLEAFRFPEQVHYEDTMTIPFVYLQDMFVEFIDKPLLGYRERPGSITSKHTGQQLQQLFAFYRQIPVSEKTPALKILKIRLARTLAYFYRELMAEDFPMHEVLSDMQAIRLDTDTRRTLEWSDWLMCAAPRLYMRINAWRIKGGLPDVPQKHTSDLSLGNMDHSTVASFGDEWARMNQSVLSEAEKAAIFADYFAMFPFDRLPTSASGFDMGCGSGRWASLVAPRVAHLCCIDPSHEALQVARRNLTGFANVDFLEKSVDSVPRPAEGYDFGYSLGVLHHVPDTAAAIASCASLLKPGAPFLLYLYYAMDNKPVWYKSIWKFSDLIRALVNRLPSAPKALASDLLAGLVYWPLARAAWIYHLMGLNTDNFPLSYYRDKSFYTMRTDARDRFGTPLEQRFSKHEIKQMLEAAGFENIQFSEGRPYWVAMAFKT